jgi:hypothetical protein
MRFSFCRKNIRQAGPVVITKIRLKYAVQYIDYAQKKMRHINKAYHNFC